MKTCSAEYCKSPAKIQGLCKKHHQRLKRTGTLVPGPLSPDFGPRLCSVEGCDRTRRANGMCMMHDQRMKKTGTVEPGPRGSGTLAERFWRKVKRDDGCWEWIGSKTTNGYGRIQQGGKGSPHLGAHRVSFELHHGDIPPGHVVMHSCDNPSCVNPDHLSVGLPRDNTLDMIDKGRKRTVAPLGVENGKSVLDESLVRYIRSQSHQTHAALARELGVGVSTIRGVRSGRCWSHVTS